jgi:hypothetical protein
MRAVTHHTMSVHMQRKQLGMFNVVGEMMHRGVINAPPQTPLEEVAAHVAGALTRSKELTT